MAREISTRQTMISGEVTDAFTGGSPRATPVVTVVRDADGAPVHGTTVRVLPGGRYVIDGDPAALPPAVAVVLRVEVEAEGYQSARRTVAFTAADLTRVTKVVTLRGASSEVRVIKTPQLGQNVAVTPRPVTLTGRVSQAEDPAEPIAGARVEITVPASVGPAVTDADGFFTLGPAPVAETVTVSVTAPGREPLERVVRLDFRSSVDQRAFALEPV